MTTVSTELLCQIPITRFDKLNTLAPSNFKRLLETIGPQDAEQNIYGQIALGMDHAYYLMMRAPKPTLIASATKDFFDIDGTWGAFRDAKRLFQRYGAGRNIELVEVDATHGWHPMIRQASVQFMVEHLAGRITEVAEPRGREPAQAARPVGGAGARAGAALDAGRYGGHRSPPASYTHDFAVRNRAVVRVSTITNSSQASAHA